MMQFRVPLLSDRAAIRKAADDSRAMENDAGFAGLYLLREKYRTEIAFDGAMLLRRYGAGIRADGYGFPLGGNPGRDPEQNLKHAAELYLQDAESRGIPLKLTMLTRAQCGQLEALFPGAWRFEPVPNYTEYIFLRENLAALKGSKYHGKRNHIAQFFRTYPDAEIQPLIPENAEFAVQIAEQWLAARSDPNAADLLEELKTIRAAAHDFEALGLCGILLYASEKPIGMSILSEISHGIYDVHFEKVIPGMPHAWPVIVRAAAQCLREAEYLNREEDLGADGMRASKMSYLPDILNEKFQAYYQPEGKNEPC